MILWLPRLFVALTALSTVLAGVPVTAPSDAGIEGVVAAQQPAGDDADKPRGERDSEESEQENEFEVKLLAERTDVAGPRCDTFVSLEVAAAVGSRRLIWPTAPIRGPPALV